MTLAVRQGTPAWLEARRSLVTATDIPVLLGLSPYKCEADLADEKLTGTAVEANLRMRVGSALQGLIGEAYTERTGRRVTPYRGIAIHPVHDWAGASPDFRVVGERRLVEAKWTTSKTRFADGLPQDIEAQVTWQMGCSAYPVTDVAVLTADDLLPPFEVAFDATLFDDLVTVATDFRRRLAAGGPFAMNDEAIRRRYPKDNGEMLPATPDLIELVEQFRAAKAAKSAADNAEKSIAAALRAIVLDRSGIDGLLTYRKNADSTRTNWPAVAAAYRTMLADSHSTDELDTLVSIHSETVPGPRVLRLLKESRDE